MDDRPSQTCRSQQRGQEVGHTKSLLLDLGSPDPSQARLSRVIPAKFELF